jgi:hypothetical protein
MPGVGDYFQGRMLTALMYWLSKLSIWYCPFFLIEADLGCRHDLSSTLVLSVQFQLQETKRIIRAPPAGKELHERHVSRRDDRNDRVCALLPFAGHSDLIAGGTHNADATVIFLSNARRRASVPLSFTSCANF